MFSFPVAHEQCGPVSEVLNQLGVVCAPTKRAENVPSDVDDTFDDSSERQTLCYDNMPFVMYSYMDYGTKNEKIVVMVELPGSGSYDWEFNEIGDVITLRVEWSRAFYDVSNTFKGEIQAQKYSLAHPKLHALQSELVKRGISQNQKPRCCITIPLGRRVQKEDDTWEVSSVTHDGNKILMLEFSGFQEEILKKVKRGTL